MGYYIKETVKVMVGKGVNSVTDALSFKVLKKTFWARLESTSFQVLLYSFILVLASNPQIKKSSIICVFVMLYQQKLPQHFLQLLYSCRQSLVGPFGRILL